MCFLVVVRDSLLAATLLTFGCLLLGRLLYDAVAHQHRVVGKHGLLALQQSLFVLLLLGTFFVWLHRLLRITHTFMPFQ